MHSRGRPKTLRRVETIPEPRFYKPQGIPSCKLRVNRLSLEEYEALRLTDLDNLDQNKAAAQLGVSRRAYWNDLKSARKKIADALACGKGLLIDGGSYILCKKRRYICHECESTLQFDSLWSPPYICPRCHHSHLSPIDS